MPQLSGSFPDDVQSAMSGVSASLIDNFASSAGQWSDGAARIQPVTAQATIARPWTIYSIGIAGKGALLPISTAPRGLLGKLYGGLLAGGTFGGNSATTFVQPPGPALPTIMKLWDGTQDAPFPMLTSARPAGGFFSETLQLPQPLQLDPGDQIAVGLWLTPNLVNDMQTLIYSVTWTIGYDVLQPR